jgi:hypothetical protein
MPKSKNASGVNQCVFAAQFLFALMCASISAANLTVGSVIVDIPSGFQGPTVAAPNTSTRTYAYVVSSVEPGPSTVIQITEIALGDGKPTSKEKTEAPAYYLMQMLSGIERHRTEYVQSKVTPVRIGGVMGTEASWTGRLRGIETRGTMFCRVDSNDILVFHVMGGGRVRSSDYEAAIAAVKAARTFHQ